MTATMFLAVLGLAAVAFLASRRRAYRIAGADLSTLHSRPAYHGTYAALWVLLAGWGILLVLSLASSLAIETHLAGRIADALPDAPQIERQLVLSDAIALSEGALASSTDDLRLEIAGRYGQLSRLRGWAVVGLVSLGALLAAWATWSKVAPGWRARNRSEAIIRVVLLAMAGIAVLTTIGIVLSLIFETLSFFNNIGWRVDKFLFGTTWSPLSGVQEGRLDPDKVGAVPLFAGTLLITLIAMLVAVPVGLFSAIYLSEFASKRVRALVKPMLEILAGIPTVVYGFFAAITVAPAIRGAGEAIGLSVASEIGAGRRAGDGDHDHSLHLVTQRRRDQRRSAIPARRILRAGRQPSPKPSGRWCCRRPCRASSRRSCWASAAR